MKRKIKENGVKNQISLIIQKVKLNQFEAQYFIIPFWFFLFLGLISFSRYQLPQYIYWLLPAAAIFTSGVVEQYICQHEKSYIFLTPYIASIVFLIVFPFTVIQINWVPPVLLVFISLLFLLKRQKPILLLSIFATAIIYFSIEISFFPFLLSYQPSSRVANTILTLEPDKKEIFTYKLPSSKRSYSFYSKRLMKPLFDKAKFFRLLEKDHVRLILVPLEYKEDLRNFLGDEVIYEILESHPSYKVATPKLNFFFQKERRLVSKDILLIRIHKKTELHSG